VGRGCCAIALLAIALQGVAGAEEGKPAPRDAAPAAAAAGSGPLAQAALPPLGAELVKTGLYLISGGGGNSLMRLSAIGAILVDGKLPGHYRPLMSQVRRINKLSDLPARVLILTDHHPHHSGDLPMFIASGVSVLLQDNARQRLPGIADAPAAAASAAPAARSPGAVVSFGRDYRLRMGGVEVQVFHFGKGHSDNDAVVFFPDLKVIAVGDLFGSEAPMPDFAAGGSLVGWRAALEQVLKLDFEIVVPSQGPLATRADLLAFKARLDTLLARAASLVNEGVGKDQLLARLKTDDLGWRLDLDNAQAERLQADLAAGR
jgi:cyclase